MTRLLKALVFPTSLGLVLGLAPLTDVGWANNGFDLSTHSVPLKDILSGGPPKDGIPAILKPHFLSAREATFLSNEDRVLGYAAGGEAKAYPIKIMNWHEIVNDVVGGTPVVITFCPLCGTGIGFDAMIDNQRFTFGVSGLLYQSDLLMYDHQTESLWSQIAMEAVAGRLTGTKLHHVFLEHTTWGHWRQQHSNTKVLSTRTGYHRNYQKDPYLGYAQRADVMFPTKHSDSRYHPKEWVVGVEVKGMYKAYPFSELSKAGYRVTDDIGGQQLVIQLNSQAQSASVLDQHGHSVPSIMAYWFAWYAFHPETQVYQAPPS